MKRVVYLLAAIPPLVLGIGGWSYGAVWFYFLLSAGCFVQWLHPTRGGWLGVFLLYLAGSLGLAYLFAIDLLRISTGHRPTTLVDRSDTVGFALIFLVLLGILIGLWIQRPHRASRSTL